MATTPLHVTAFYGKAVPSRDDPDNFAAEGDIWMGAFQPFQDQVNPLSDQLNAQADAAIASAAAAAASVTTATAQAGIATTKAGEASASAVAAAASAASAAALAGAFAGTSTTSLTIGIGSRTFATQTGEAYTNGITMTAVSAANPNNMMAGQVTAYNSGTGALTINVTATGGAGTYADWNLSLAGVQGPPGPGITPQAVGWTGTGGTTPKTLTVDANAKTSHILTPGQVWGRILSM